MASLTGAPLEVVGHDVIAQNVVAIDGKTSRRSGHRKSSKPAIHMVSAFAASETTNAAHAQTTPPANFTTIKQIALNLTRRAPGKDSLRLRRKVAAWDDDFLVSLVAA